MCELLLKQYIFNYLLEYNKTIDKPILISALTLIFYFLAIRMPASDLYRAIRNKDLRRVSSLLRWKRPSPDGDGSESHPPLVECIRTGEYTTPPGGEDQEDERTCQVVKVLLQHGANPDSRARANRRMTSAMYAAERGFLRCLRVLDEHGADFDLMSLAGETALSFALREERGSCVMFLLTRMSKEAMDQKDEDGETVLSTAVSLPGSEPFLQSLIQAGINLESRDGHDRTALMRAVYHGRRLVVDLLLKNGVDVNGVTEAGKTALTYVLKYNYKFDYGIALKLLLAGGDPARTPQDRDHLHRMVAKNIRVLVKALVENGFPPLDLHWWNRVKSDSEGEGCRRPGTKPAISPLAVALLLRRPDIAKFFIANRFFTKFDILQLGWDPVIRWSLQLTQTSRSRSRLRSRSGSRSRSKESLRKESLEILDFLASEPQSLFTLSLVAVSTALSHCLVQENPDPRSIGHTSVRIWDARPTYRDKINLLRLPQPLKALLLRETPLARVCYKAWADIPLLSNKDTFRASECKCAFCRGDNASDYYSDDDSD